MKSFKKKRSNKVTSRTNTVHGNALQVLINIPSPTTDLLIITIINSLGVASVDGKL